MRPIIIFRNSITAKESKWEAFGTDGMSPPPPPVTGNLEQSSRNSKYTTLISAAPNYKKISYIYNFENLSV
jgi:hypothetical protein